MLFKNTLTTAGCKYQEDIEMLHIEANKYLVIGGNNDIPLFTIVDDYLPDEVSEIVDHTSNFVTLLDYGQLFVLECTIKQLGLEIE